MTQSASASLSPHHAIAILHHPVTALIVVIAVATVWASIGFASALFTNEIVVSDDSYGVVRSSFAGPVAMVLLAIGFITGRGLRPRYNTAR